MASSSEATKWAKFLSVFIEDELDYFKSLNFLKSEFVDPLRENLKKSDIIISRDISDTIFTDHIDVFLGIHRDLYYDLSNCLEKPNPLEKAADVFLKKSDFFKLYRNYLTNHQKSLKTYWDTFRKNAKFQQFIEQQHDKLTKIRITWTVDIMLTKPNVRINSYKTFLETSRQSCNFCDKCTICEANRKMQTILEFLGKTPKLLGSDDQSSFKKLLELQERLVGDINICAPNRRILHTEQVTYLQSHDKKKVRLELVLFSDALLITKPKKTKLKFIRFIPIDKVIAEDAEDAGQNHFKLDAFGWVYNLAVDNLVSKENLIFTVDKVKKQHREFLSENSNSLFSTSFTLRNLSSVTWTRETAVAQLESIATITKPPRCVIKVVERFDDATKEYITQVGQFEIGNKYEIGRYGSIFGREVEDNDKVTRILITSDDSISRRNAERPGHAAIEFRDKVFQIRDLGSSGSTYLISRSGEITRLSKELGTASDWFNLEEGMKIQMGRTRFEVLLIELEPVGTPLSRQPTPKMMISETDSAETFVFTPDTVQAIQKAVAKQQQLQQQQMKLVEQPIPSLRENCQ